jgi:hypothetical protein
MLNIVKCWMVLDRLTTSCTCYSTENAVRIGNSFITIPITRNSQLFLTLLRVYTIITKITSLIISCEKGERLTLPSAAALADSCKAKKWLRRVCTYIYCTMLGSLTSSHRQLYRVKTPFGLLIPLLQTQSHFTGRSR